MGDRGPRRRYRRWWPDVRPVTVERVVGGRLDAEVAGGGLGESVAVLAVGDQDVRVVEQPLDGRGREALGHQLVES